MGQPSDYESEEVVWSDAVVEDTLHRRKTKIEEKHILQLVRDVNRLQKQCSDVETENIALR